MPFFSLMADLGFHTVVFINFRKIGLLLKYNPNPAISFEFRPTFHDNLATVKLAKLITMVSILLGSSNPSSFSPGEIVKVPICPDR
jgi:hypothetical protein